MQLEKSKELAQSTTALSMALFLTGATPPEKKKVVLLEHWKGVEKAQKYYLHFFFQTFPHSPSKLNRTPTKSFAVTAKVNPLSNFSDCPGSLHCKRKIKFYASDYEHHTSQSKHGQPGLRLSGTENVQQL